MQHHSRLEAEAKKAWNDAPPEWQEQARALGMEPSEREASNAQEFHEASREDSYTPDPASIDTITDEIIERVGGQHREAVIISVQMLVEPVKRLVMQEKAAIIGQVAVLLVQTEAKQIRPRIHGLLHAVPRLASCNGFASLRASARDCNVSPEWMRKTRDNWCHILGIPVPEEGQKSPLAKLRYAQSNGGAQHWRRKKFTNTQPIKPIIKCPRPKPIPTNSLSASETTDPQNQSATLRLAV